MDYSVEYRKNKMPMGLFRQRYQDKEKFMAYCRECPRYDTVWSCPPLDIDAEAYLFPLVDAICAESAAGKQVSHAGCRIR